MFGLFKKTSWRIDNEVKQFFRTLFSELPSEFQFLQEHLEKGVYRRYSINKNNNYYISFDPDQSDKSMVKCKNFQIENIQVISEGQQWQLDLTIYQGLLVGFDTSKNIKELRKYEFDTSGAMKTRSKFAAEDKIERLVKGLDADKLDLQDLSEIELEGKSYYQIKDLDDGNYIAIDGKGQVFALIHDPFEIRLLNKSVKDFVAAVNSGTFRFEEIFQH